jgi:hypothetical protein
MIVKNRFFPFFKPLALAAALAAVSSTQGAETAKDDTIQNPWAFNLSAYLWLPSVYGDFSAGSFNSLLIPASSISCRSSAISRGLSMGILKHTMSGWGSIWMGITLVFATLLPPIGRGKFVIDE